MSTFTDIITSKDTWMVVLIFVLAFLGVNIVEKLITTKDTLIPLIGVIPSIVLWYFYFVRKTNK